MGPDRRRVSSTIAAQPSAVAADAAMKSPPISARDRGDLVARSSRHRHARARARESESRRAADPAPAARHECHARVRRRSRRPATGASTYFRPRCSRTAANAPSTPVEPDLAADEALDRHRATRDQRERVGIALPALVRRRADPLAAHEAHLAIVDDIEVERRVRRVAEAGEEHDAAARGDGADARPRRVPLPRSSGSRRRSRRPPRPAPRHRPHPLAPNSRASSRRSACGSTTVTSRPRSAATATICSPI